MTYLCTLQSCADAKRLDFGITGDLRKSLRSHHAGELTPTSTSAPWSVEADVGLTGDAKAAALGRDVMKASGGAFAQKRL